LDDFDVKLNQIFHDSEKELKNIWSKTVIDWSEMEALQNQFDEKLKAERRERKIKYKGLKRQNRAELREILKKLKV